MQQNIVKYDLLENIKYRSFYNGYITEIATIERKFTLSIEFYSNEKVPKKGQETTI